MSEVQVINSDPVPADQLVAIDGFDETLAVPSACVGCEVLTTKRSAEAIGMVVRLETVPGHAEKELYFPDIDSKKDQAKQELADRAKNATSGMCKFIIHQACWRMESS